MRKASFFLRHQLFSFLWMRKWSLLIILTVIVIIMLMIIIIIIIIIIIRRGMKDKKESTGQLIDMS